MYLQIIWIFFWLVFNFFEDQSNLYFRISLVILLRHGPCNDSILVFVRSFFFFTFADKNLNASKFCADIVQHTTSSWSFFPSHMDFTPCLPQYLSTDSEEIFSDFWISVYFPSLHHYVTRFQVTHPPWVLCLSPQCSKNTLL